MLIPKFNLVTNLSASEWQQLNILFGERRKNLEYLFYKLSEFLGSGANLLQSTRRDGKEFFLKTRQNHEL